MTEVDSGPGAKLVAGASPERVAGLLVVSLAVAAGILVLSGGPLASAVPSATPGTSVAPTAPTSRPAASPSSDAEPDAAALRTVIALDAELSKVADELERELAADPPQVGRLAEGLRHVNVVVVAGEPAIDRLATDPATSELGDALAEVYDAIRERVGSTLSNSLVARRAYIEGSEAVVALVRSLEPLQTDLHARLDAIASASP